MPIRVLSQNLINQIAAGEVIERPASVIKELIENSIDAKATSISITVKNSGKTYISITDNGTGMNKTDLENCTLRHATSKLPTDDLLNINFLGFRGEAIPSIASISKMTITSNDGKECWSLKIENGNINSITPASFPKGTKIEVENLFYNVPARLNFLKTDRGEMSAIIDTVERIALSNPDKTFTINDTIVLRPTNTLDRICNIIGNDFKQNAIEINDTIYNLKVTGFVGRPTFTKSTSAYEYIYVNGRSLKDKVLQGVIKAAYMDTMEKGKFPVVCLWLSLPNNEIDVNVHPQKAEIRFKEQNLVRGGLINIIRKHLATAPINPNIIEANYFIKRENEQLKNLYNVTNMLNYNYSPYNYTSDINFTNYSYFMNNFYSNNFNKNSQKTRDFNYQIQNLSYTNNEPINKYQVRENEPTFDSHFAPPRININKIKSDNPNWEDYIHYPLGSARGQLHNTYIISQTTDGIIIMDQHAAHERLVYERIKKQIETGGVKRQILLIPEIVELGIKKANSILDVKLELETFGLVIEEFGSGSIIVRETPAIIGSIDIKNLINHIAEDINDLNKAKILENKTAMISKTYACHTSIRAGKSLTIDEMNELLRQVENSENAGECNHGRRSYVKLNLYDLGKLFDR